MATSNRGKEKSVPLPPGGYRLRLLTLDPQSTAAGQRVFEVKVADAPADRVDLFHRAGGANRIVELVYPVTLESPGAVDVTLTPVQGQAILCGAVLEPAGSADRAPRQPSLQQMLRRRWMSSCAFRLTATQRERVVTSCRLGRWETPSPSACR